MMIEHLQSNMSTKKDIINIQKQISPKASIGQLDHL